MDVKEASEALSEASEKNRFLIIFISVMAVLLSLVEMSAGSELSQSSAHNIAASDLWAFFQAKSIRETTLKTAADGMETLLAAGLSPDQAQLLQRKIGQWRSTAERYESDPATGEGRKEIRQRALAAERLRDRASDLDERFEFSAAMLQIALVLCSAAVMVGVRLLTFGAIGLGALGTLLGLWGWLGIFLH